MTRFSNNIIYFQLSILLVQLLLMKRGGQIIYVGPLGRNSPNLVEYFEVSIFFSSIPTFDSIYQFLD